MAPASAPMSSAPSGERRFRLFFAVGSVFVVIGGLVAAVTGPLDLARGSWLAAYLVLVWGVAQCAIGGAERALTAAMIDRRFWSEFALWNGGNALVVVGTFLGLPLVVDLGGAALVATLVLSLYAVRGSDRRRSLLAYRMVVAALLVSIPIGLVLAHVRSA